MDIKNLCPGCMHINEEEGKCPVCGYDGEQNDARFLPVRYILSGRYIIGKVISHTCESVVYLAFDSAANRAVNIKEFFPEGIAVRGEENDVLCPEEYADTFKTTLDEFWNLNKKIADLELPSLAKIIVVFEENGTAYAVSEAVVGITLKEFLKKNEGSLKWEQARPLFLPLLDTVIGLNKAGIVHGGISPESIVVGRDGRVRLGEILISPVRRMNKKISAQIYGGYAAIEQYEPEKYEIGEHTDVYSLSATLFRVLMGNVPESATDRLKEDKLSVPSSVASELPRQVLVAMANGLQVLPENRTETSERFRDELVYGETDEENIAPAVAGKKAEKGKSPKKDKKDKKEKEETKSNVKVWLISVLITILVFLGVAAALVFGVFRDQIFKKDTTSKDDDSMPSVASIGDVDSSAVASLQTYEVPNLLGKTFAEIKADDRYSRFTITLEKKVYTNIFQKGTVCEQSIEAGSSAPVGSEIKIAISLGPMDFQMPTVTGMSELAAKVQLLRAGLLYENIEVVEKYDSDKAPATVIDQSPAAGESVTEDSVVRIYINSYEGSSGEENQ